MPAPHRTRRSPLVILALLAIIAVESTGVVIARSAAPATGGSASVGTGAVAPLPSIADPGDDPTARAEVPWTQATAIAAAIPAGTEWTGRSTVDTPNASARAESKGGGTSIGGTVRGTLTGRNKVWIPSLGIRRSVSGFSCSSTAYPGNRVYRWGCAGHNNVYLFGHAHSVFKPLHDAYVRGRLKKGMRVLYADGRGRVSTYRVIWWRVVKPDRGAFAYAAQSRPSLTLQTCVGARSQYRLVVRLVKVG